MTAAQRYEDARQAAAKWPKELEQLKATNMAVNQAFNYYMATRDLQSALVMCITILSEANANLTEETMRLLRNQTLSIVLPSDLNGERKDER